MSNSKSIGRANGVKKLISGAFALGLSCTLLSAMPIAADASTFSGKLANLTYGKDTNRVSVVVIGTHALSCGTASNSYTFSGKQFWNDAFLRALANDKTVNITGTGTCTLGVEEIDNFNVVK